MTAKYNRADTPYPVKLQMVYDVLNGL